MSIEETTIYSNRSFIGKDRDQINAMAVKITTYGVGNTVDVSFDLRYEQGSIKLWRSLWTVGDAADLGRELQSIEHQLLAIRGELSKIVTDGLLPVSREEAMNTIIDVPQPPKRQFFAPLLRWVRGLR